jgi:hypothetical protein
MVEKIVIEEKFALVNKNSGLKWNESEMELPKGTNDIMF